MSTTKDQETKENKTMAQLDSCLVSSTQRVGVGLLVGFAASVVVRRPWPIVLGTGIPLGQSIGVCRAILKEEEIKNGNGKDNKSKTVAEQKKSEDDKDTKKPDEQTIAD